MVNLMNLFGNKGGSSKQRFRRTYDLENFNLDANVDLAQDKWTEFGSLTVPAQQEITFGSNDPTGGASISGAPTYVKLMNTSGSAISAKIRFSLTNANETSTFVVLEETTSRLSAAESDRQKAVLLPEYSKRVGEDSKLLLTALTTQASQTIDYDATETKASIPVTVYQ